MRRIFILLVAIVTLMSCSKEDQQGTTLELKITKQPVFTQSTSVVSSSFTGTIIGLQQPVTVIIEWFVESPFQENPMHVSTQLVTFNEGTSVAKETVNPVKDPYNSNPTYYWVRFSWSDSNGIQYVVSEKVYCKK